MDNRPIGIFDSGLGGLSAVKEMKSVLPNERIIYFGDTGRVPYGSKSKETIERYARGDADFLMKFDIKLILAACGTVSAVALEEIKNDYSVPLFGVVDSAVDAAVQRTKNKKIAVIGTSATIKSGIFKKKINESGCISAVSKECPLLVPLIECGYTDRQNPIRIPCILHMKSKTKIVMEFYEDICPRNTLNAFAIAVNFPESESITVNERSA